VTTAVATGDLSRKITVEVRGEILELKNTSTPWWTSSAHSRRKSRVSPAKWELGRAMLGAPNSPHATAGDFKDLNGSS